MGVRASFVFAVAWASLMAAACTEPGCPIGTVVVDKDQCAALAEANPPDAASGTERNESATTAQPPEPPASSNADVDTNAGVAGTNAEGSGAPIPAAQAGASGSGTMVPPQAGAPAPASVPSAGGPAPPADPCASAGCHVEASCSVLAGQAQCTCVTPYKGDGRTCRIPTCAGVQCHAQAHCVFLSGVPTCSCNDGFEGDGTSRCIDVNECTTDQPCDANATCTNTVGGAECQCNEGFEGSGFTCQRRNACQPNPCVHGRCTDTAAGASCDCSNTDYSGDRCQTPIDDCASNRCRNGATCVDGDREFTCECTKGWTGTFCDEDVCADANCSEPFVCVPVEPGDPGVTGAAALCSASCYPNCSAGSRCIRSEDCRSRSCDFDSGGVCL